MTSVLFIVDHHDSGGAPIVVRDLISGLVDQGVSVTLIVLSDRVTHAIPSDVSCICLPFQPRSKWERIRRYRLHAHQLDQWLNTKPSIHFDLVVAHLHHAHQVTRRSRLAQQAWYCLHADPVVAFLGNKSGLGRRLKRRKVAKLYTGRKVIGVSQGIIDRLQSLLHARPLKAVAIHNPVDLAAIEHRAASTPDDIPERYLLFVGRLEQRQKRLDRLLDAYEASQTALPLLIVGEGGSRAWLTQQIKDRQLTEKVQLLGHRDNPYGYMKHATALLMTSDYEGFPLVLIETLACNTPVISTDCPTGPSEVLIGHMRRYLIPMQDTQAFSDAINTVVKQPVTIPGEAVERFSLERVVARYLSLAENHSIR